MNRERWNRDYPQMPESFHDTVLKEVLRHTQVSTPKKKHRSPENISSDRHRCRLRFRRHCHQRRACAQVCLSGMAGAFGP